MNLTEPLVTPVGELPRPIKERLLEDLSRLTHDTEELLRATASQTGEQLAAARDRTQESLLAAKARLAEARIVAGERARAVAGGADEFARENPWQAVAIAGTAALVIGMLIARR